MTDTRERIKRLESLLRERIVVLDGSWGVLIQREMTGEEAYRGERFADHPNDVAGDPDLLNITRPEVILDIHRRYFAAGAEGFTSSVANFMPQVALDLYAAASSGDFTRARGIFEDKVQDFYSLRAKKRGYEVSSVKTAMELCGLPAGPVRPPLVELNEQERDSVRALVERLGVRAKIPA